MIERETFSGGGGGAGEQLRVPGRLYLNAEEAYTSPRQLQDRFNDLRHRARQYEHVTRTVMRAVIDDRTMASVAAGMGQYLEVAAPLGPVGLEGWFIYLAENQGSRQSPWNRQRLLTNTRPYEQPRTTPYQPSRPFPNKAELEFDEEPRPRDDGQLIGLWQPPFGWTAEGVAEHRQRVHSERNATGERTIWHSTVRHGDQLLAVAEAEVSPIVGLDGQTIRAIENSEWSTRKEYQGHGLGTMAVAHVNRQIQRDMEQAGAAYFAYSECVMRSDAPCHGSYPVGHGAGMTIPERTYAGQFVIRNVNMYGQLEDFVFMYVTRQAMQEVAV